MTDAIQTVREALEHDARKDRFYRASTDALDRVEAVVKAAREYRHMRAANPADYQQNKKAEADLFDALSALEHVALEAAT